ncbi:probable RNA-dependent RNA polymerase 5 isoform X2 [Arachis ipaensis]|uniref:probable RNA-dependent RNA polymerase 5 isoform X2 n=1 Tax=Arachis ipaensis TaxID=130454 RepID=UPI000A2B3E66|nr:probable RNA-dependent RNA polymerase 5 isoform X2 [Arachis ipaensis]QHO13553.1 putative RNA-dependent RNA polymerase [Arachis hypogaea]
MANCTNQVPLPLSVETLIEEICQKHNPPPLDRTLRLKLADIGEQRALEILNQIRKSGIKTSFSGFIKVMIDNSSSSPSSSPYKEQVPLPTKVEILIEQICNEQKKPPLDSVVRRKLAAIGEQRALDILNCIKEREIQKSFGGFVITMIKDLSSSSPSPSQYASSLSATNDNTEDSVTLSLSTHQDTVGLGSSQAVVTELKRNPLDFYAERREEKMLSPQMKALGELEFRRAFLLLSYIGGESLETLQPDYISSLKDLPMGRFERTIWQDVGHKYIKDCRDRQSYVDWDSSRPHVYQCYVSTDGSLRFKGPVIQSSRTHLQRTLGDDNVLLVKFSEEESVTKTRITVDEAINLYEKFGKEGIQVGLRLYRFFVFKDGGKEEKKKDPASSSVKCYFVRMKSLSSADERASYILEDRTMIEARCLFMHAHTLASVDKYMARFSLLLSKTFKLDIDLASVNVKQIDDEYCLDEKGERIPDIDGKLRIHTDGTGFISEDLASSFPTSVFKGTAKNKVTKPLLIQCRLFHKGSAIKGTLLVNHTLPPRTIQVRDSMIKVKSDKELENAPSIDSLEVVGTSNHPNRSFLSKYLIALLSYGGVPNGYFIEVLQDNLKEVDQIFSNKRAAFRASLNHGEMDDYTAMRMILCGISIEEPHLQFQLSVFAKEEMKKLRGGRIYIPDSFYLMGTVDPTGKLERNQVCVIHENGPITGEVLVYRNPGLHFGDIHRMVAVPLEELKSYVGDSKYAIFFPCVGPRSVADEIAGGDFDGDMYWVSQNSELLKSFRQSDPWIETRPEEPHDKEPRDKEQNVKEPRDMSSDEFEERLFRLYLKTRFEPSIAIGAAADSWMAIMDRFLTIRNEEEKERVKENIIRLVNIYYVALDAPKKSGRKIEVPKELSAELFPHYMEKEKSFTSTSVLGMIYDEVRRWQHKEDSAIEIKKLPCFDIEVPKTRLENWQNLYEEYRSDMDAALRDKENDKDASKEKADEVIKYYKQKLYDGADNMEDSARDINDIYIDALAVYNATYDHAMAVKQVGKCGFAWKVAGLPLCSLYNLKQDEKAFVVSLSVLREIG